MPLPMFILWLPKNNPQLLGPRQKECKEQRDGLEIGQIKKHVEQVCWVNICFTPVLLALTKNSNTAPLPGQLVPVP